MYTERGMCAGAGAHVNVNHFLQQNHHQVPKCGGSATCIRGTPFLTHIDDMLYTSATIDMIDGSELAGASIHRLIQ